MADNNNDFFKQVQGCLILVIGGILYLFCCGLFRGCDFDEDGPRHTQNIPADEQELCINTENS